MGCEKFGFTLIKHFYATEIIIFLLNYKSEWAGMLPRTTSLLGAYKNGTGKTNTEGEKRAKIMLYVYSFLCIIVLHGLACD